MWHLPKHPWNWLQFFWRTAIFMNWYVNREINLLAFIGFITIYLYIYITVRGRRGCKGGHRLNRRPVTVTRCCYNRVNRLTRYTIIKVPTYQQKFFFWSKKQEFQEGAGGGNNCLGKVLIKFKVSVSKSIGPQPLPREQWFCEKIISFCQEQSHYKQSHIKGKNMFRQVGKYKSLQIHIKIC